MTKNKELQLQNNDRKQMIHQGFDIVAADYDHPSLSFFPETAKRLVENLQLNPTDHLLDVCTGTGCVALAAAEKLTQGKVTGIDLSSAMLQQAKTKAVEKNLSNTDFPENEYTVPVFWGGEINWVSSGEVAFCHIKDTKEKITSEGLNNTSTAMHPPGTVMLGMIGEGKTRGQAAILDIYAAHNQNTVAIEKCVDEQSSEYLYYYLMQQYELTRKRGSGNNQKALNKTRVQSIDFPLPPLAEQKIISVILVEKFSAIERLENEIDRQLFKAEKNKQSVLSHSFSGKISS